MMKRVFKEKGGEPFEFVLASIINNSKELILRIRSNKLRISILIITVIILKVFGLNFAFWGLLSIILLLLLGRYFDDIARYRKKSLSPLNEAELIVTTSRFERVTPGYPKIVSVLWDDITVIFDNRIIGNLTLYQSNTEEYHLFFQSRFKKEEFEEFRNIALSKKNKKT